MIITVITIDANGLPNITKEEAAVYMGEVNMVVAVGSKKYLIPRSEVEGERKEEAG